MKKNLTFNGRGSWILILLVLAFLNIENGAAQCALTIGVSKVNPTCYGDCDGSITALPAHGSGSYTYLWSTGSTVQTISNLCAGTYTVTVTDVVTQCVLSRSVTILKGRVGSTITITNATCGECNGALSVQPHGGNGKPYTFLWSTGDTSATITGLCPGVYYTVTITDRLGCTQVCRKKVNNVGTPFNLDETIVNNTNCPPDNCNGSVTVVPSVINGSYSYLWNTGATTATIDELCEGSYTVTVTNGSGCSVTETYSVGDDSDCEECDNDFTTYTQGGWGNPGAPGQYMAANFESCFGSIVIGDPCGYTITLNTVQAVQDFLPQGGTPAALTQNYTDPGSGDITVLAGQLLAVAFALGFDDCDTSFSGSTSDLGDQIYINDSSAFYGWSIQAIYDTARRVLSGCPSNYSPSEVNEALTDVNENYDGGINNGMFVCPGDFNGATRILQNSPSVSIYPNPFKETLFINLTGDERCTITVADVSGRIIETFVNVSGSFEIRNNWKKGIYFITFEGITFRDVIKVVRTE